ncbi:hypothetical protein DAI18_03425 [Microvirgula aerodenitrificans]|uniref:Prepilin-type N-terminal cleavage/methylation domain-containing protein n=1 Tax=Microvirgula aerodenitrificans TaxID=57480 RepID=A0A2S0PF02_9NEIS|nr:hypothetical protein DAI18_03425 [Microvirgula aerodenitrificans]
MRQLRRWSPAATGRHNRWTSRAAALTGRVMTPGWMPSPETGASRGWPRCQRRAALIRNRGATSRGAVACGHWRGGTRCRRSPDRTASASRAAVAAIRCRRRTARRRAGRGRRRETIGWGTMARPAEPVPRGFTLIELAISLAIVGLLLGMFALPALNLLRHRTGTAAFSLRADDAVAALEQFAIEACRLPCPARAGGQPARRTRGHAPVSASCRGGRWGCRMVMTGMAICTAMWSVRRMPKRADCTASRPPRSGSGRCRSPPVTRRSRWRRH